MRDESKNVELSTARRTHPALPIVQMDPAISVIGVSVRTDTRNTARVFHSACRTPDCLGWGSARAFHC